MSSCSGPNGEAIGTHASVIGAMVYRVGSLGSQTAAQKEQQMNEVEAVQTAVNGTPKLNEALAKAQLVMLAAKKDSVNPHFKSNYADLASIIEACRKPLAENGLAFAQLVTTDKAGVTVTTKLLHASGECIEAPCWLPVATQTPQAYGSAISYARRYGLASLVGCAAEDDDGNASSGSGSKMPAPAGIEKLKEQLTGGVGIQRTHQNIQMGRFGARSGEMLFDLNDDEVSFYRAACKKTLADPVKEKWHASEGLRLACYDAELRFRGLPV